MRCLGSGVEKLFPGATLRGDVIVQDDNDPGQTRCGCDQYRDQVSGFENCEDIA
jgi:hypothetical protein